MKKILIAPLLILLFVSLLSVVPATSQAQQLVVTVDGINVNLDWSAMPAATSYTLCYALADYKGDVDINTIDSMEMGSQKSLYVPGLPSGLIIYVAVLAHTASGDVLSNIEQFMGFAGTVTFPETGDVVMVVDEPGGVGNFTVSGTRDASGEITAITQIAYTGATESYIMTVKNDRPDTITQDNITTRFIYQADGSITFETVSNHTVSVLATKASAAGVGTSLCDQYADKSAYEIALRASEKVKREVLSELYYLQYPKLFLDWFENNPPGFLSNSKAFRYSLYCLLVQTCAILAQTNAHGLNVIRTNLRLIIGYYELVLDSMYGVYDEIIEKKLAEYDLECNVPSIQGVFKGTYTIQVYGCLNNDDNRMYSGAMSISITEQNHNVFSGTFTGVLAVDNFTFSEIGSISGTIDSLGNIRGTTKHTALGTSGTGTFTGTYSGNNLTITNSGKDTAGDICSYTRQITVFKQ